MLCQPTVELCGVQPPGVNHLSGVIVNSQIPPTCWSDRETVTCGHPALMDRIGSCEHRNGQFGFAARLPGRGEIMDMSRTRASYSITLELPLLFREGLHPGMT